jgi:hypothetical protein
MRAWLRATCLDRNFRDGKKAVSDARIACTATIWRDADFIDTMAAAAAETGDFDAAVRYQEQVLAKKLSPEVRSGAVRRLALYKQRKPYRENLR